MGFLCRLRYVIQEKRESIGSQLTVSQYVRVYGQLKSWNGTTSVTAYSIVPLADMNEITMHMHEVLVAHAFLIKAAKGVLKVDSLRTRNIYVGNFEIFLITTFYFFKIHFLNLPLKAW